MSPVVTPARNEGKVYASNLPYDSSGLNFDSISHAIVHKLDEFGEQVMFVSFLISYCKVTEVLFRDTNLLTYVRLTPKLRNHIQRER